jgi:hypothetical protein
MLADARFLSTIIKNSIASRETIMRRLLACAAIAMIAAASGTSIAAAPDPVVGTWQLNVLKSTFSVGPVIRSQTRTYSQSGDKITLVMKTAGADGKEVTTHTTYQLNGKDFPVTGTPDYDSLSAKRIDSNTAEFVLKKDGKEIGTTSRAVSKDGKTLTTKTDVTTATGGKSENIMVFDKK